MQTLLAVMQERYLKQIFLCLPCEPNGFFYRLNVIRFSLAVLTVHVSEKRTAPPPQKKHILIEITVDWHNINHWNKGSDFQLNITHTHLRWGRKTALAKVMEDKLLFNAAPNMPWGINRRCIFYILLCHIVSATPLHTVKSSNMAGFTLDTSSHKDMGVIFCHGITKI